MPKKPTRSVDEIADELVEKRRQPFAAWGLNFEGDIFYSDITRIAKQEKVEFSALCDAMKTRGFWIHS